MLYTGNINAQLDDLLQRVGYKLQISKTQRELAEGHYNAVAKWLTKDEVVFKENDLNVYPQGSLRIGTTVKPMQQQEYDLDLVIEIDDKWDEKDPIELLNIIETRLRENEMYSEKIERKNRCIRLKYAHEFHMDILPAHPADMSEDTSVKVPDRKAKNWKDSNPKGYAAWFDERAQQYFMILEKSAKIDPFPEDESFEHKPPLKRAVQLIKRFRDIYFEEDPDNAPISIVLTTLAGHCYAGQLSVADSVTTILNGILSLLSNNKERLVVKNPSNENEDLSERWDVSPELYESFLKFISDFKIRWDNLLELKGIHKISEELKKMFGESIVIESLKEQGDFFEKLRKNEQLSVLNERGTLTAAVSVGTTPIRKNTFYGG